MKTKANASTRGSFPFLPCIISVALAILAGCYVNPVTGRSYTVLTSVGQEVKLGAQAFDGIKKEEKISRDPQANARVRRIAGRLAEVIGEAVPEANWEFVVFDSDTLNAFALPGGKVGVYTGLMNLLDDDDELAAVIGHEIGHVVARHGGKRMSQGMIVGVIGAVGGAMVENTELFKQAYGGITNAAFVLPHSRKDEQEADMMGLHYAALAGYDPEAAVRVWQKMDGVAKPENATPAWLSTHPTNAQRIADLSAAAPRYRETYLANKDRFADRS